MYNDLDLKNDILKLYIYISKVDKGITIKEIDKIIYYLKELFKKEKINKNDIENLIDTQIDLKKTCKKIQSKINDNELIYLMINLFCLVYVDKESENELSALDQIMDYFEVDKKISDEIKSIFNNNSNEKNSNILFASGLEFQEDLPIANLNGRFALYKNDEDIFLIILTAGNILLNHEIIYNNYRAIILNNNDRVSIKDKNMFFNKEKIEKILLNNQSSQEEVFWVGEDGGTINVTHDYIKKHFLKIINKNNCLHIEKLSKNHNIKISGKNIDIKKTPYKIYEDEILQIDGLKGDLFFGDIEEDSVHNIEEKEKVLFLSDFSSLLSGEASIKVSKKYRDNIIEINNYKGDIFFNNKKNTAKKINIKDGDLIRIANLNIKVSEKDNEISLHIKEVKIGNITVDNIFYKFKNKKDYAIEGASFSLNTGSVTAIMGPAGSGKSTLLNLLMGKKKVLEGSIKINGQNVKRGLYDIRDEVGFVPQDDLLIEVLTVYENLYYKYKLKNPQSKESKTEIRNKIESILNEVGLIHKKDEIVGSPLKRRLSGGERKRLNIALELINDPEVIILDEPTTGLSSQDAEEIIRVLKDFSRDGKIILLVIHQPSSNIYEMFDNVIILNKKGKVIVFGNNIDVLKLFLELQKTDRDNKFLKCPTCNLLNPDIMMRTLKFESEEYWDAMDILLKRSDYYHSVSSEDQLSNNFSFIPKKNKINIITRFKQTLTQIKRLFICKLRDKINIFVTLGLAPALSILVSLIFKHNKDSMAYSFADNTMYPNFLFIVVLAAIFFGLSNSINEIIKDKLILKRERLINISIGWYYFSKFFVLLIFALIQSILFVAISHFILEEHYMILTNILIMTVITCCGISIGMLISTFANSFVSAYNIIPVIFVPQILLAGAMLQFNVMNHPLILLWEKNNENPIPPIAEVMISRWGYELIFTANKDFHPSTSIPGKKKTSMNNLKKDFENRKIDRKEFKDKEDNIKNNYEYLELKYEKTKNKELFKIADKTYNEFLSVYNNTYKKFYKGKENILLKKTWFRDLMILIFFIIFYNIFGYISLKYRDN